MKRLAFLFSVVPFLVLPVFAADAPAKECTLCVGAVSDLTTTPATAVPLLVRVPETGLATAGSALDTLSPEQRRKTTVIVSYVIDKTADPLQEVETHTKTIVDWARTRGPFQSFGVSFEAPNKDVADYAIKRLAVTAQGLNVADKIVTDGQAPAAYYDEILVDASRVADTLKWIAENDPSKKIVATVDPQSPNAFFDLAQALANGATRAYLNVGQAPSPVLQALANFNRMFGGDWAYDSTSQTTVLDAKGNAVSMPVLTFVRGEDLRTIVVPKGDASAASIVSLPTDRYERPRRIDAAGERDITDTGRKGGHLLVGVQPVKAPFAITAEHAEKPQQNVTKESLSVATQRGITVEEIIRNHQAYKTFQESIQPRYIALDTTKLRFDMTGGEAIEATIAGDYFSQPKVLNDWVWQDFYINGVKWKYGRMPELPIIQPEKVTQLPLDIHLTNEYRYQLVRETDVDGYHTYEVRFEPPQNAPESLPLYRGTVWIDAKSWARIRLSMVQLNLSGEVLSNEEQVLFQPFEKGTNKPLSAADVANIDSRSVFWLPREVNAEQVVSAAGRATPVLRQTTFSNFRIDPPEFDRLHAEVSASDARMIRETDKGMQYLEKTGTGERVVKQGFDTARTFMLGGVHHDSGLEYPVVPLGGVDYFNFNLANRGIQTNVFFAGIIVAANATNPNVANTRTNVGVDFFGIALPTTNSIFRNGEEHKSEAVKSLPTSLYFRAGHPFLGFGKADVTFGVSHRTYRKADDTAADFVVPSSTFELSPGIDAQYSRWGYTVTGFYDYNHRTAWKPWGDLAEYDPAQQNYSTFGTSFAKSLYLPKFQRVTLDLNYLDGQHLDRFSKYELGFFGSQRIHGIRSGSVRAEKAMIGHLSYGFVFSQQFRLEAFYDHGLITDRAAGYSREPFQGLGIAGQTVGPWGTLLRLDIGKTVGRNAQDGFVANVVFLKLF
ncbi:MAG TPA: hypothetical protein VJ901_02700 [Thermoanaerobaculia bacterium]|nr:hypothetical protein [Thermoanaerobaculia bacterium]